MKFVATILTTSVICSAGSISLDEALATARAAHPSVEIAKADLDAARARSSQALGAVVPAVTATSDWSRLGPNLGGDPRSNPATRMDGDAQWRSVLGARWTVFDGFRSWNALGSTSAREKAAEASLQDAEGTVLEIVAARWGALWLAQRREAFAESTFATSRARLSVSLLRRGIGTEAGLESRQAALDARRDSLALLRARAARLQASRSLELSMGRQAEASAVAADPGAPDTSDPLAGAAVSEPTDIRALREVADASGRELSATRGGWWPELSLYANHVWLGSLNDADPPGDTWSQGMVYGASASWTLFEGGRNLMRTREAAAIRTKAATALSSREREVAGALDAARTRWETAKVAWTLETDNAVQAGMVLDAALSRYRTGDLSGLDLRRYQDSRDQALVGAEEARVELLVARLALRRAAGLTPLD